MDPHRVSLSTLWASGCSLQQLALALDRLCLVPARSLARPGPSCPAPDNPTTVTGQRVDSGGCPPLHWSIADWTVTGQRVNSGGCPPLHWSLADWCYCLLDGIQAPGSVDSWGSMPHTKTGCPQYSNRKPRVFWLSIITCTYKMEIEFSMHFSHIFMYIL